MRLHRTLVIAVLALALAPAAALASTKGSKLPKLPKLSLRVANHAADATASSIADSWQGDDGSEIDDYDLADCTRASRTKLDCAVTYYLDDGSTCDDTIHVKQNRKGRPVTTSDSDDGDTQTFDNCTDPEDDPVLDDGSSDTGDDTGDDPAVVDDGSDA